MASWNDCLIAFDNCCCVHKCVLLELTCTHSVSCSRNVIFIKYSRASFAVEVIAGHLVWPSANRSREWALLCTGRETNIDRNSGLWFHSSSRLFALHSTSYYVHTHQLEIRNTWINDVALQLLGTASYLGEGEILFSSLPTTFQFLVG